MLRIAILEDDPKMLTEIHGIVQDALYDMPAQIDLFESGKKLDKARDTTEYQLYLLDIEVGQENGIEIGQKIRQTNANSEIIFITSHCEYALAGYDAHPLGYLIKPIDREKFESLLKRVIEKMQKPSAFVEITENHRKISLSVDEIIAIVHKKRKTILYMYSKDCYETTESVKSLFHRLPEKKRFLYIHRNTLVRIDHIASLGSKGFEENLVVMKNGSSFLASREGIRFLKQVIVKER